VRTSDAVNELATALASAQSSMGPAIKGARNPHFRSSYADLSSVVEAIREPFTANGLAWVQAPALDVERNVVTVTTRILHTSGQWVEAEVSAVPGRGKGADLSPQSVGSCITYLRRYGLQALAGVPAADDDAELAMGRGGRSAPRGGARGSAPMSRPTSPPPAPPAARWSDEERARFCAALGDLGLQYEAVAAYCERVKRPRPSAMGEERRVQLLAYLQGAPDVVSELGE
jgi:hypothetical protein